MSTGEPASSEGGAPTEGQPATDRAAVVIEGIVVTVSVGDDTMVLEQPARGFRVVELAPRAQLIHADGTAADLAEHIATGSAIRATGGPGSAPEVLLATRVEILGDE
ncbi:MAG: hypothetical protein M3N32_10575 [Actinomycetota bacterium]|nr:hypothetical protein [Actinomycetota bacterium]